MPWLDAGLAKLADVGTSAGHDVESGVKGGEPNSMTAETGSGDGVEGDIQSKTPERKSEETVLAQGPSGYEEEEEEPLFSFQNEKDFAKLLKQVPKDEKEFIERFVTTQQFSVFSERLEENYKEEQELLALMKRRIHLMLEEEEQRKATIMEVIRTQEKQLAECEARMEHLHNEIVLMNHKPPSKQFFQRNSSIFNVSQMLNV